MVVVRLSRGGAKKKPFYKIVVTDSRNRRDGRYIEQLGFFNPVARGQEVKLKLDTEKLIAWQKNGAQLSDRVNKLAKDFAKENNITVVEPAKKTAVAPKKTAPKAEAAPKAETKVAKKAPAKKPAAKKATKSSE